MEKFDYFYPIWAHQFPGYGESVTIIGTIRPKICFEGVTWYIKAEKIITAEKSAHLYIDR
jgi:hypothetical protein